MIIEDKCFTKERHYNKIDSISRLKGGAANKGTSIFIKAYQGLTFGGRTAKSASEASDNGRCWWIHDYIMGDNRALRVDTHKEYEGNPKDLHPTYSIV